MSIHDKLSEVFDVEVTPKQEIITADGEIVTPSDSKIEDDYEATRKNLHLLLFQGQDALMNALEVAKQSEHPRAFEVVGNLMKQLADVNQQLMDLHKQKQVLDNPKGSETKGKTVNNNAIFVGSTSELNKFLSNMNKGE
jgi:capsule polysaccharide export protein KpsE/RkpR